jgi:hypothetical protein
MYHTRFLSSSQPDLGEIILLFGWKISRFRKTTFWLAGKYLDLDRDEFRCAFSIPDD